MGLTRTEHWRTREFHNFLLKNEDIPFEWGVNDCALFAANAVKSFTGIDLAADFRGLYTTEIGAFRTIKKLTGGTTVADAAAYCANQAGLVEHKHPLRAKSGDLVIVNNGGNLIAGVVHLNGRHVVSVSETGLVRLLICDRGGKSNIVRSWSI